MNAGTAAGYPRRIAVAPFASLGSEDIGQTVALLPRLMASRLMALSGADVLILPAGEKPAEEAAREAKLPLLLQGTVSKLGKGYSIDVTVTDLAEGKNAGAFFVSAATEDDIIAQLGILSAQVAERVFGVQGAVQAVSPAPAIGVPAVAAPVPTQAIGGVAVAAPSAQAPAAVAAPGAATLAGGWVPTSIKKVAQSDKIPDELNGIVTVQTDDEGNGLVAAFGRSTIHFYRIQGNEILPYTRIRRSIGDHILSIDALDLDGDGEKEILVTILMEESVQSIVLKKKGDVYEEVADKIRYYLVVLPDWMGKPMLVGQYQGVTVPFQGKIVPLRWDGKQVSPGEPFPHRTDISPLWTGVLGLSSARFGNAWNLIYTDEDAFLRVLDAEGKSQFKSRIAYGLNLDFFEWGPVIEIDGRRKRIPLRMAVRVAPGSGENPLILTTEVKRGLLDLTGGSYDSTRLVLLRWDVGEFLEKAGTPGTSQFLSGADFLTRSDFRKGGRVVASVIEQPGGIFKEQISRLYLYKVE